MDVAWCDSTTPISGKRPGRSTPGQTLNVMTRVRSVLIRPAPADETSTWRGLRKLEGIPPGCETSGSLWRFAPRPSIRRSISRTASIYFVTFAAISRPEALIELGHACDHRIEQALVRFDLVRRACRSVLRLRRTSARIHARDPFSIGSGVLAPRQAMVFVYAQLNRFARTGQVPALDGELRASRAGVATCRLSARSTIDGKCRRQYLRGVRSLRVDVGQKSRGGARVHAAPFVQSRGRTRESAQHQ